MPKIIFCNTITIYLPRNSTYILVKTVIKSVEYFSKCARTYKQMVEKGSLFFPNNKYNLCYSGII